MGRRRVGATPLAAAVVGMTSSRCSLCRDDRRSVGGRSVQDGAGAMALGCNLLGALAIGGERSVGLARRERDRGGDCSELVLGETVFSDGAAFGAHLPRGALRSGALLGALAFGGAGSSDCGRGACDRCGRD